MDKAQIFREIRKGNHALRNKFVEENIGLVRSVVKRFLGRGYDSEDLFQIGCVGLLKAVDRFEEEYQVQFSTYAVPWIMGEIRRFLRDDGMIHVNRSMQELRGKVIRERAVLEQKYGREVTVGELAKSLDCEEQELVMALDATKIAESTDVPGQESHCKTEKQEDKITNQMLLEQLMDELPSRDRHIIQYRYYQDMTQKDVAALLGISQVQVSRIEKKILLRMRERAGVCPEDVIIN